LALSRFQLILKGANYVAKCHTLWPGRNFYRGAQQNNNKTHPSRLFSLLPEKKDNKSEFSLYIKVLAARLLAAAAVASVADVNNEAGHIVNECHFSQSEQR
jgi:hypothetical protein